MITGDTVNLRSGPGLGYKVLGQITQGTWVEVKEESSGWVRVLYNSKEYWVAGWLIEIDLQSKNLVAIVNGSIVNLRRGPGTEYSVLSTVKKGERLKALGKRGDWIRVERSDGTNCWISAEFVILETAESPKKPLPPIDPSKMLVYPLGDRVTVWQTAIKNGDIVSYLTPSSPGRYLGTKGGWIWVMTGSGSKGWVPGSEVRLASPEDGDVFYKVSDGLWCMGKYQKSEVTASAVNVRSGPGTDYEVLDLVHKGDILLVLGKSGDWLNIISPKGKVGWVASWLTGGVEPASCPFSVTVEASEAVRRVTVTGTFDSAAILPGPVENSILVSTSIFFENRGTLGIGAYEFDHIELATSDFKIVFNEKPNYRVAEMAPGRVVLDFSPAVPQIFAEQRDGRDVLTVSTLGYAWPEVKQSDNTVELFIPGASFSGIAPKAPGRFLKSIEIQPSPEGVRVIMVKQSGSSFALKKADNTLEAHFLSPGLRGKVITVDPGHGDTDSGAVGRTGLKEETVNLEVALRLKKLLEEAGAVVHITRDVGTLVTPPPDWNPSQEEYEGELAKRAAWTRSSDAFVSIHCDAHWISAVNGTSTYYSTRPLNSSSSLKLSAAIQRELTSALGSTNRGVMEADFFVLRQSHCPAALVEVGFLTNPEEESRLRDPVVLDRAALGIFRGLEAYFGR